MKAWAVIGECGEHSDRETWVCCVHRTAEGAVVKQVMFKTWAELNGCAMAGEGEPHPSPTREQYDELKRVWELSFPLYPFHMDYTGIQWYTQQLEYEPDEQIPGHGLVGGGD